MGMLMFVEAGLILLQAIIAMLHVTEVAAMLLMAVTWTLAADTEIPVAVLPSLLSTKTMMIILAAKTVEVVAQTTTTVQATSAPTAIIPTRAAILVDIPPRNVRLKSHLV